MIEKIITYSDCCIRGDELIIKDLWKILPQKFQVNFDVEHHMVRSCVQYEGGNNMVATPYTMIWKISKGWFNTLVHHETTRLPDFWCYENSILKYDLVRGDAEIALNSLNEWIETNFAEFYEKYIGTITKEKERTDKVKANKMTLKHYGVGDCTPKRSWFSRLFNGE